MQDEIEEFHPADRKEWRQWLEDNHEDKDAVWVIFYKKKSPRFNMSWSVSVDEALCFGWIDSVKKTIDDERYKQYFSKRKANSIWSKINKDKVSYLDSKNLMQDAGYKAIEIAKSNGSWTILDDVEALRLPVDLENELNKRAGAMEFYENLSNSAKKTLLSWVVLAKRPETKLKRIVEIANNAENKMKPKQFR